MKQDKINLSPFSKCTCRRELHVSNTKFSYGCGNMTLDFFYKSLGKQKNHRLNRNFNSLLLLLLRFLIFLNSFFYNSPFYDSVRSLLTTFSYL